MSAIYERGEPIDLSGACDDCRSGFHGDCRGVEHVVAGGPSCACDCPDARQSQLNKSRVEGGQLAP